MQAQEYYRLISGASNDRADDARYLSVNCAGICVLPEPFRSHNPEGRSDYYLMYLTAGTLRISVGDDTWDRDLYQLLRPGQFFVFPPRTAYAYEPDDGQEIRYYWIHFTGFGAAGLLSECAIPVGAVRTVGFPEGIEELYRTLFRAFILRTPNFETAAYSSLAGICSIFGDALREHETGSGTDGGERKRHFYTSVSYLHENLAKPLSVPMLAAMEHLSESRYRTLFSELMGVTPSVYITGLRISRACELLEQTELSLLQIAEAVGYDDPQYFSRVFRRQTGEPPSFFRKRRKKLL